MISHILLEADMDPTISVGGILKSYRREYPGGEAPVLSLQKRANTPNSFPSLLPEDQRDLKYRRRPPGFL